jgi:hypothetical protein
MSLLKVALALSVTVTLKVTLVSCSKLRAFSAFSFSAAPSISKRSSLTAKVKVSDESASVADSVPIEAPATFSETLLADKVIFVGVLLAGGAGGVESLELPPQAVNPSVDAITATDNKLFLALNMFSSELKNN